MIFWAMRFYSGKWAYFTALCDGCFERSERRDWARGNGINGGPDGAKLNPSQWYEIAEGEDGPRYCEYCGYDDRLDDVDEFIEDDEFAEIDDAPPEPAQFQWQPVINDLIAGWNVPPVNYINLGNNPGA